MLRLRNIYKGYDRKVIFSGFNLDIREGVTTGIHGASGCGKTTLLNIIGGLVTPENGLVEGTENKTFSYIFQEPRLLPWLTVRQNVEFVLDSSCRDKADFYIKLVGLQGFEDYYPAQLSGGMSQRVSVARAFAVPSDIILMDEPFGGIDVNLKKNIIEKFQQICENDKRTVIFVTHDLDESLSMSDDIVVLGNSPAEVVFAKNNVKKESADILKETIINSL